MSMVNNIKSVNESAKKVHGDDICIMVARCIAFGHNDNLLIISGKKHKAAAMDLLKVIPGATTWEEEHEEMDWGDGDVSPAYTTSLVKF